MSEALYGQPLHRSPRHVGFLTVTSMLKLPGHFPLDGGKSNLEKRGHVCIVDDVAVNPSKPLG